MRRTPFFSALALVGALTACSTADVTSARTIVPALDGGTQHASWIDTAKSATVFEASDEDLSVDGYNQKTGQLTETITFATGLYPQGIAVDKNGYLYVALPGFGINLYPPGSTTSSLTLTYPGAAPWGIAVSARGEVAVSDSKTGTIYFYKKGATTPFNQVSSSLSSAGYDCYDAKGNLYIASYFAGPPAVAEIVGGGKGKSGTTLGITNLVGAGGIQVDSRNELLVLDTSAKVVYHYQLPNPTGPSGTTPLGGNPYSPIDFALTASEKAFWVGDFQYRTLDEYAFPKGGWPKTWIRTGFYSTPLSVAVAPAAKP